MLVILFNSYLDGSDISFQMNPGLLSETKAQLYSNADACAVLQCGIGCYKRVHRPLCYPPFPPLSVYNFISAENCSPANVHHFYFLSRHCSRHTPAFIRHVYSLRKTCDWDQCALKRSRLETFTADLLNPLCT